MVDKGRKVKETEKAEALAMADFIELPGFAPFPLRIGLPEVSTESQSSCLTEDTCFESLDSLRLRELLGEGRNRTETGSDATCHKTISPFHKKCHKMDEECSDADSGQSNRIGVLGNVRRLVRQNAFKARPSSGRRLVRQNAFRLPKDFRLVDSHGGIVDIDWLLNL